MRSSFDRARYWVLGSRACDPEELYFDWAGLRCWDSSEDIVSGPAGGPGTPFPAFDVPPVPSGGPGPVPVVPLIGLLVPPCDRFVVYLQEVSNAGNPTLALAATPPPIVLDFRRGEPCQGESIAQAGNPAIVKPPTYRTFGFLAKYSGVTFRAIEVWGGVPPVIGVAQNAQRLQLKFLCDRIGACCEESFSVGTFVNTS